MVEVSPARTWPDSPPAPRPRLAAEDWIGALAVAAVGAGLRLAALAMMCAANGERLREALLSWDAKYYLEIARAGYFEANVAADGPAHHLTLAFFPGFPLLIRAVASVGIPLPAAALAINGVCLVLLAAGVMALAARMGGGGSLSARVAAAAVVTCAPMSIVFSMPYTEALFGALLVWALVALADAKWIAAGALALCLSTVRLTAVDLLLAFAIVVALRQPRNWRAWCAVAASALPLAAYLLWASTHLRDVGGYFGTQSEHWNSGFDGGVATVRWILETLGTAGDGGYLLSALAIIAAPVLLALSWRRLPLPAWLFCAALALNVLLSDGIMHSRPRLLLPLALTLLPLVLRCAGGRRPAALWAGIGTWALFGAWFSAYMLVVFEWAI